MQSGNEKGLFSWINSFLPEHEHCEKLSQLSDGVIFAEIVSHISRNDFDLSIINRHTDDDWALKLSNLKKTIKYIEAHFDELCDLHIDLARVDLPAIARESDLSATTVFVEILIAYAVHCPEKQYYIRQIMNLDQEAQSSIMTILEGLQGRTPRGGQLSAQKRRKHSKRDFSEDEEDEDDESCSDGVSSGFNSHRKTPAKELDMTPVHEDSPVHLESEKKKWDDEKRRLMIRLEGLEHDNLAQAGEIEKLKMEQEELGRKYNDALAENQIHLAENQKIKSSLMLGTTEVEYEKKIAQLQAELNTKTQSFGELKQTCKTLETKYEEENQKLKDELDLLNERVYQMSKNEASLENYKKKFESYTDLKKRNKELDALVNQYEDKANSYDTMTNELESLQKAVNFYKNESMTSKSAITTLESSVEELKLEHNSLDREVKHYKQVNQQLQDRIGDLKKEIESRDSLVDSERSTIFGESIERGKSLHEIMEEDMLKRVQFLEQENKLLKVKEVTSEEVLVLQEKYSDLERHKGQLETSYSNALSRIQSLEESHLNESTEMTESFQDRVRKLETANMRLRKERDGLQKETADLKTQKESERKTLEEELTQLRNDKSESLNGIQKVYKEKEELYNSYMSVKDEIIAIQSKVVSKETEITLLQSNMEKLEAKLSETQKMEQQASQELAVIRVQKESLEKENTNMMNHPKMTLSSQCTTEGSNNSETVKELQLERDQLKLEVTQLRHELKERADRVLVLQKEIEEQRLKVKRTVEKETQDLIGNFNEKLAFLEDQIEERDQEIEFLHQVRSESRDLLEREEMLLMGAFHEVGMEFQKRKKAERDFQPW
eukprot:CAMPEP_0114992854 /NCGR_PEP_ID=MMETSP0216-20121206/12186_1 /TAXON_ID=223996 /ORGANISM="Protocruzia adherens, Strain Boccale" /LENGTH=837 /DNA_ID=CAMNT_0002356393 /DNA_START=5871 /DNA_END=8381 /DNA_ORIENTATION=+